MDEKLYMVLADGYYLDPFGSYVDFVGIFCTKDQAEDVIKQQPEKIRESCRVVPVRVGEAHNMEQYTYEIGGKTIITDEYECGFRLGGYAE